MSNSLKDLKEVDELLNILREIVHHRNRQAYSNPLYRASIHTGAWELIEDFCGEVFSFTRSPDWDCNGAPGIAIIDTLHAVITLTYRSVGHLLSDLTAATVSKLLMNWSFYYPEQSRYLTDQIRRAIDTVTNPSLAHDQEKLARRKKQVALLTHQVIKTLDDTLDSVTGEKFISMGDPAHLKVADAGRTWSGVWCLRGDEHSATLTSEFNAAHHCWRVCLSGFFEGEYRRITKDFDGLAARQITLSTAAQHLKSYLKKGSR